MDQSNASENEITHSIIEVKVEPFDDDDHDDFTQNLDPLAPDNIVHIKMEQDFKKEIQVDASYQATKEDILKNEGNNEMKMEELDITAAGFGNETGALDGIPDTCRIIQDDRGRQNEHGCTQRKKTEKKTTTKYEPSRSYARHGSDVIKEDPTYDVNTSNATSLDIHSGASSDSCSSEVNAPMIHKHSISEEEGSNQSSVIAHSLGRPSYVCDICDMTFKNSRNLVNHKVVHTDQKPHVCGICQKKFSYLSDLVRHKRIHTGQKPYVCDICKKEFNQSSNLITHRRIHTDQKPYVCDICTKGFNQSSNLATHKRIHTGQKLYFCDTCKKGFSRSSALVKHKRIHTGQKPYVCNICKKEFNQSSNLVTHERIHTGVKPYVCDICNMGFSNLSGLSRHKLIHTDEKPYSCDICKKGFRHASALTTHTRIHFRQNP